MSNYFCKEHTVKHVARLSIVLLVVGSVVGLAWANKACQRSESIDIMVSPNTLVLSSFCDAVTVHSNIPYSTVDAATVTINGVAVNTWADDCGDLVARISVADLGVLQPGEITLTLSGTSVDGKGFVASETITVK